MSISRATALAAVMFFSAGGAFATEAEIEAARAQWMELFSAGDGTAVAEQSFAEDAMLLPPDSPPVEGREAIAAF